MPSASSYESLWFPEPPKSLSLIKGLGDLRMLPNLLRTLSPTASPFKLKDACFAGVTYRPNPHFYIWWTSFPSLNLVLTIETTCVHWAAGRDAVALDMREVWL